MILFPLVFGTVPTPAAVLARMDAFLLSHTAISAKFTFQSSKGSGSGTLTFRFPTGSPTQVDWVYEGNGERVRFVSSNGIGISINQTHSSYDRGVVGPVPAPTANVFRPVAYPTFLIGKGFDSQAFNKATGSVKPMAGADRLTYTEVRPGRSTSQVDLDVDSQGRLLRMQVSDPPDEGFVFNFSDYRVDAAALPSSFDVDPPIGDVPFSFDESYAPFHPGQPLPVIPLSGTKSTTLAAISMSPGLLAFVDDPFPAGLLEALKRINSEVPVTLITLGSTRPAGFTTYSATEVDFDHAGIQATPQFYLVNSGKVTQAWLGFRKDHAVSFEAEVKAALSGAR